MLIIYIVGLCRAPWRIPTLCSGRWVRQVEIVRLAAQNLTGVLLVIVATFFMSLAKMHWGHFWEDNAATGKINFKGPEAAIANCLEKAGFAFLALAALMFIPRSIYAIRGFLP